MEKRQIANSIAVFGVVIAVVSGCETAPTRSEGGGESRTETIMLPGSVPLEMVSIPAGTFLMGRYPGEEASSDTATQSIWENPQHRVTLSSGF